MLQLSHPLTAGFVCTYADDSWHLVIRTAAEKLGVSTEMFADNAFEDETNSDDDDDVQGPDGVWRKRDGSDPMEGLEGTAPQPGDFHRQVYDEATPLLGRLIENPDDSEAQKS